MSCYQKIFKLTKNLCQNNLIKREVTARYYSNIDRIDSSINSTGQLIKDPAQPIQLVEHEIDEFLKKEMKIPGALDECQEDVSFVSPYLQPTFNFASVANESKTIQELVKLGVELYRIEGQKGGMELLLKLSFDEDIKPYIQFLSDCGVPAERLGRFITKNPFIFQEEMDDLTTRIRYLRAHDFTAENIAMIVDKNPYWLSFSTKSIDKRLGYLQVEFKLSGPELRKLIVKNSMLGTFKHSCLVATTFSIREEMGFEPWQVKQILLNNPFLWELTKWKIVDCFDYVHNTMGLTHEILAKQPAILGIRLEKIQQRHKYLEVLKRNQYDPLKPHYVSPDSIALGNDIQFCTNVAKTSIRLYDLFLKTL